MKNQTKLQIFFSIIFLTLILYLIYLILSFFINILNEIKPETTATILASMITVLISVSGLIYTQKLIKQREIEEAHRSKKIEIYNKFITISTNMIAAENEKHSAKPYTENELIEAIFDFKKDLLLWGSPDVIKSVIQFQEDSNNQEKILISVNNIYETIRKDIGLDNKELKNYELIKIFINNPNEIDELLKKK